jgi:hypothetical protein
MPTNARVRERRGLRPEFLRTAFAEFETAGPRQCPGSLGVYIFGHADQRHVLRPPPGSCRRPRNPFPHVAQIFGDSLCRVHFGAER